MVAQDTRRMEIYRRTTNWDFELYTAGEVYLASVDLSININEIYRQVSLDP